MADPKILNDIWMPMISLIKWFQENLFNPIGFMQLAAVGASYLIAWLLAAPEPDLSKRLDSDANNTFVWSDIS
jgi:hypothetical protein